MPRPQRVVTLREMRGSRPGRVLLATSDPAVVRAVERAMARRLDPAPMPPEPLSEAAVDESVSAEQLLESGAPCPHSAGCELKETDRPRDDQIPKDGRMGPP